MPPRKQPEKQAPEPQFPADQPVPSNVEVEQNLLGSILLMPECLDEIASVVAGSDFFDTAHQTIFGAIRERYDGGKRFDVAILVDDLKRKGKLDEIGGYAYLGKLAQSVPHAGHALYYASIVREKSVQRGIIAACAQTMAEAYEEAQPARDVLNAGEQRFHALLNERETKATTSIKEVLHNAIDRADLRASGDFEGGVKTGFGELDTLTGGLHPGQLVILAARPSMGKTAFALNVAENVALESELPVLFVSLEMSEAELGDRMLASISRVNGHRLRAGTIGPEERRKIREAAAKMHDAPFFVDDNATRSVTDIAAAARRTRRKAKGLGLIVVDYLQLVDPDDHRIPREQQVARITKRLKALARELHVPVLCLAQLNRQTEQGNDHRPKLSHLRESGAIEQDADVVFFVHRESYYDERVQDQTAAEIIIAKQRSGPRGDAKVVWRKEFTRFEDKAPERFGEIDDWNRGDVEYSEIGGDEF